MNDASDEHRGGDSVQASALLHERRDEHGHEQNPQERQDVRDTESNTRSERYLPARVQPLFSLGSGG